MLQDKIRMHLFFHTLKEATKALIFSQRPEITQLYNDMVQKFTMKFLPLTRVHQIRNEIHTFK